MSEKQKLEPDEINQVKSRKFSEMGGLEKVTFVGKVFLFLITGGFAFPTIFSD